MKKLQNLKGDVVKLSAPEERERKAIAYAAGTTGGTYSPLFAFEQEYYNKGKADDARLREEIAKGDR